MRIEEITPKPKRRPLVKSEYKKARRCWGRAATGLAMAALVHSRLVGSAPSPDASYRTQGGPAAWSRGLWAAVAGPDQSGLNEARCWLT